MMALNNKFILRPYQQGQGIKTEIRGGLALPGQKLNLVPLEMLASSKIDDVVYPEGSLAYLAEDSLMTGDWAKKIRKAPGIDGEFIVVDSQFVIAVEVPRKPRNGPRF